MKILIYTDNHFCEKFSIVQKMGTKYTQRLENQIKSINWAEDLAEKEGCQYVICAGDFFDKPDLTDMELTALREIKWASGCAHYFLVGNHESEEGDLHFNSAKALEGRNRFVISEPKLFEEPGFELAFLPYIKEDRKQDVIDYFAEKKAPRLLISHNDLLGIQMGPTVSTIGFKPEDLASIADFVVNGHLHNGQKVNDKVINLGNLTGKDFGEDAFRYSHNVMIFDTEAWTYKLVENPYAFNFYKVEISYEEYQKADLRKLLQLKNNAVVSASVDSRVAQDVREAVNALANIVESRIMLTHIAIAEDPAADIADLTVDHYVKFAECCREKLENTPILEAELNEILK